MKIAKIAGVGTDFDYKWPSGDVEHYSVWIDYLVRMEDGQHTIRIGAGNRFTYGQERVRLVAWIDGQPQAEFLGADDFADSGEVLCEIKLRGDPGERICRYPKEPVPVRYSGLQVVGLPTRVTGDGVHGAWAVVASIADHSAIAALATLRRIERDR